jgi:starch synthase
VDGLEYYGQVSFLKAGVQYATHLTTVSATYAREIQTPDNGMGFDGMLQRRAHDLTGIVNGIDDEVWDPATDSALVQPYSARRLAGKARNKAALQQQLGLDPAPDVPLFIVISRLTRQKGLDVLAAVVPDLLERGAQLAVLGTGDDDLVDAFVAAAAANQGRVATTIGYDETLSHRMQAGGDAIFVPSRFEPCGLTQLCGLRYGTLPVVARVGGLVDTVIDANVAALHDGVATGFQFAPVEPGALVAALDRVIELYRDRPAWARTVRRAMGRDVGWRTAAGQYADLYRHLVEEHTRVA